MECDPRLAVKQASLILYPEALVDASATLAGAIQSVPIYFECLGAWSGLVKIDEVVAHGLDSGPVSAPRSQVFLGRFIRAQICRARQDVHAVVHSHAPDVFRSR